MLNSCHCNFSVVQRGLFFEWVFLIVLRFNDTSTLVGHFVSSPREREKRDRRDSRRDERDEQGRKRNRNESEETEEIKIFPLYLTCYKDSCKPISVGRPGDARYTTPLHHSTTPLSQCKTWNGTYWLKVQTQIRHHTVCLNYRCSVKPGLLRSQAPRSPIQVLTVIPVA